jgi:hypothetical protein
MAAPQHLSIIGLLCSLVSCLRKVTDKFNSLQVRRLKMYNSGRAVRDRKGKVVSQDLQSKELPSTRIVPDRRWFGNTRVVGQKQLQAFREQMAGKADNPFAVLLRQRKLPLQVRPTYHNNRTEAHIASAPTLILQCVQQMPQFI